MHTQISSQQERDENCIDVSSSLLQKDIILMGRLYGESGSRTIEIWTGNYHCKICAEMIWLETFLSYKLLAVGIISREDLALQSSLNKLNAGRGQAQMSVEEQSKGHERW